MRRILVIIGVGFGFLVAIASPALAKGAGQVVLSGPGLSKPITIGGTATQQGLGAFWEFMSQTGILEGGNAIAPLEPLGPRYRLTIYISPFERPGTPFDLSKADRFTISMYPYAVNGPWFQIPEGIHTRAFDLSAGWTSGSSGAVDILIRHGLPRTSPVFFSTQAPPSATSPRAAVPPLGAAPPQAHAAHSSSGVWAGVATGGALALLVVAAGIAGRPRKVAP
jgi:hypothetical protein